MDTRGFIPPAPLKCDGDLLRNWADFRYKFSVYMEAAGLNKEPEKRKTAIFLNFIGEEALQLHRNKIIKYQQWEHGRESLKIIMKGYEDHFKACRESVVFNTVQFDARKQSDNESFQSFLEAVALLAEACKFDNKERAIRDKIISGINDSNLRSKLIMMEDQSLENVVDVCRSYELQQNKKKLPQASNDEALFFLQKKIFLNQQQQSNQYNQGISRGDQTPSGSQQNSEQIKRKSMTRPVEADRSKKSRHEESYELERGECSYLGQNRQTPAKNVANRGNVNGISPPTANPRNNYPKPGTSVFANPKPGTSAFVNPKPGPSGVTFGKNTPEKNKKNAANGYDCTFCGKRYVRYPNLMSHMKLHSGKGLFTCARCGKTFLHLKKLECHTAKTHHTNL